jgi:hypothetical protein
MGCGGACGGNCACAARKPSDPRRIGLKAPPSSILEIVRGLMYEDPLGVVVVLTEAEYEELRAK